MKIKTMTFRAPRVLVGAMVVSGMIAGSFATVPSAFAANNEAVWDGEAGDNKFSTAQNWVGDTVPANGDVIKFINLSTDGRKEYTLNNDLNVALGGLIYGVPGGNADNNYAGSNYDINTLRFQNNATITALPSGGSIVSIADSITAEGSLTLVGRAWMDASKSDIAVQVPGDLTFKDIPLICRGGGGDNAASFRTTHGNLIVDNAHVNAVGSPSSIIVKSGGAITFTENYGGAITFEAGDASGCATGETSPRLWIYDNVVLSGAITLQDDVEYDVSANATLTLTGTLSGSGHSLVASKYSAGTFVNNTTSNDSKTPGGKQEVSYTEEAPITDSKPEEYLNVMPKHIVTLNGTRGAVSVLETGILKGNGTARSIYVSNGGIVAPGNSAGQLTVLESLQLGGVYQAEIKDAGSYDQVRVGEEYTSTSGNAVELGSTSQLQLSFLDNWSVKQGDAFTIIDNRSTSAVSGTFAGLEEGGRIVVNGITFSISYVGGDGNDVVLTALNSGAAPSAPNTGIAALAQANPAAIAGVGVVAAMLLIAAKRRQTQR